MALVVGVLLGGEFLWSLRDLVAIIGEASQSGHLSLALLAMLYSGARALILITGGVLLLSGRWRTRSESTRSHRLIVRPEV